MSPMYILVFISQAVILEVVASISLGLDTAFPWVIILCSAYLKVLQNRISTLRNLSCWSRFKRCEDDIYKKLIELVKFHQNILLYVLL